MRGISVLFFVLVTQVMLAQTAVREFTPDANGNMVPREMAVASDGDHALLKQSVNGVQVPVEQSETRTLSEGLNGKVTETIVHHYGPDGEILSTDRIVTEEHKRADGGSSVQATIQHSDLNGTYKEVERRSTDTQVQGKTSTSETTISRIGLDGTLTPEEKRKVVTSGDQKESHQEEEVYKVSASGLFTQSARNVTDQKSMPDGKNTSQTAHYEVDYDGRIALDNLKVTTSVKAPDGSQITEVNTYGYQAGRTRGDADPQGLQSQARTVRSMNPDGTISEKLTVALPSLSDSNRLGPANIVSEKVCAGKCDEPKAK